MIVVTGATGFIGSNLLAGLEAMGYADIVGVDTFGTGDKWKNVAKRSAIKFVFPEQMSDFISDNCGAINALVHLGGISSTVETDVDAIVKTNIQLTMRLYRFCRHNNIPFIYASSAATYGNGEQGWMDSQEMITLNRLQPMNPYGWSKHCVDKLIASDKGFEHESCQAVGLKFFNVYGPNEYHKGGQRSVMCTFYEQYRNEGKARLFKSYRQGCADGDQKRDFVYVDDCVKVILWMLEHPGVRGLFNVGTGRAGTFREVAELVARYAGSEPKIEYVDMPSSVKTNYQYHTEADISKLRSVGYDTEMTSLQEGVRQYVENYLIKQDKYK